MLGLLGKFTHIYIYTHVHIHIVCVIYYVHRNRYKYTYTHIYIHTYMCVCARVFLWRKLLSSAVDKVLFYYAYIGRHASLGAKIYIYIEILYIPMRM